MRIDSQLEKSMPEFFNATKTQLRTEEEGADTILFLTVADEISSFKSGEFFFDRKPAAKHLFLGGTNYDDDEVDRLALRLHGMIQEGGFSLPE